MKRTSFIRIGIGLALFVALTVLAFFAASNLDERGLLHSLIETTGVFGIVLVAIASGLNAFVPLPPATFAPLFLEAGFSHTTIIACFVIGTFIADSIGYAIGWFGRDYAQTSFSRIAERIHVFLENHSRLVIPFAFIYFALAPLPNEVILIPLALSGYPYRTLILPIILGNILHHTLLVYGYENVFKWLF